MLISEQSLRECDGRRTSLDSSDVRHEPVDEFARRERIVALAAVADLARRAGRILARAEFWRRQRERERERERGESRKRKKKIREKYR